MLVITGEEVKTGLDSEPVELLVDETQNNEDQSENPTSKTTYGKLEDRENRPTNIYKILYAKELAKNKGRTPSGNNELERTKDKLRHSKDREAKLRSKFEKEEANVAHQKERVKHYIKLYKAECAKYSILSKQMKASTSPIKKEKEIKKGVKDFLASTSLPSAQQKCLLNPKQKWAKCSKEDIAQALVIRSLSPKTYNHLQQEFKHKRKLYYPTRQTLERHMDGMVSCRPG